MRHITKVLAALLLSASSTAALADDSGVAGHFQVRLRGLAVVPDSHVSLSIGGTPIPSTTKLTNSFEPEIDGTYFITDHIAVEAIAAVTQHSVHNSAAGNVGSVWLLPPTVTLQYHLDPTGPIRPYVGAGLNYTFFFSPKSPLTGIHYSDNAGFALQAGVDIPIGNSPYFINADVKKIFLSTTVKANGGVRARADINPWIIGAGIGIRF